MELQDGFEAIAEIWDERSGEDGDYFHNHLIYPSLLKVLGSVEGLDALDIGCGSGASSRLLARHGARVIGVDKSESLIKFAEQREERNPRGIEYLATDAADLSAFADARFDIVVANMALMDIARVAETIAESSRVLRSGGRLVATLFHPCFQPPNRSAWEIEIADKWRRISRKVWSYREVYEDRGPIFLDPPVEATYYHRPLGWYVATLVEAGLLVDAIDEPVPDETFKTERPEDYQRHAAIPVIMTIGARKAG